MATLEMLSGRSKKEYAQEVQAVAEAPDGALVTNGAAENDLDAVVQHGFFLVHAAEHGVEHRTEVKLTLASVGIATPDLDAWVQRARGLR